MPLDIEYNDRNYKVHIIFKMSMIDGKGGSFCILCSCSQGEAVCDQQHFSINRSGDEVKEIRDKLSKGDLKKRPHDQHVRKGVTRVTCDRFRNDSNN